MLELFIIQKDEDCDFIVSDLAGLLEFQKGWIDQGSVDAGLDFLVSWENVLSVLHWHQYVNISTLITFAPLTQTTEDSLKITLSSTPGQSDYISINEVHLITDVTDDNMESVGWIILGILGFFVILGFGCGLAIVYQRRQQQFQLLWQSCVNKFITSKSGEKWKSPLPSCIRRHVNGHNPFASLSVNLNLIPWPQLIDTPGEINIDSNPITTIVDDIIIVAVLLIQILSGIQGVANSFTWLGPGFRTGIPSVSPLIRNPMSYLIKRGNDRNGQGRQGGQIRVRRKTRYRAQRWGRDRSGLCWRRIDCPKVICRRMTGFTFWPLWYQNPACNLNRYQNGNDDERDENCILQTNHLYIVLIKQYLDFLQRLNNC